jgi:signal transduction histidine kinase
MEKVRINEIILDVIAAAKLNPNLSEHVMLDTKLDIPIEVVADKVLITQLLGNIIGNAAKFTTSGNITVETHVNFKENKIEIRIVDTGSGIPDDIYPNLFEKFSTKRGSGNDQSGTGLGLFISKAIVLAHGGQISAFNNNNLSGSTFSILLPINRNKIL